MKNKRTFKERLKIKGHVIARILYVMGFTPNASSNVLDQTTYGYGELDTYGSWQYYLYMKD